MKIFYRLTFFTREVNRKNFVFPKLYSICVTHFPEAAEKNSPQTGQEGFDLSSFD